MSGSTDCLPPHLRSGITILAVSLFLGGCCGLGRMYETTERQWTRTKLTFKSLDSAIEECMGDTQPIVEECMAQTGTEMEPAACRSANRGSFYGCMDSKGFALREVRVWECGPMKLF